MNLTSNLSWMKLVAVAAVLVVAATGCANGSDANTLTVYSGRSEELVAPVIEDFTGSTGIEVDVRFGDSDELALLIAEEGSDTPADVFISQSPGAVGFLDNRSLLTELSADTTALVDEAVRDDDNRWIGISGRQRVLVYNPDEVTADKLPSGVAELTDPAWAGRVGIAPGNGSFQDFVTSMRFSWGEAETAGWLEAMAANDAQTYAKNSAIVAAVEGGEVDAGLVNHYYNFRAQAENPDHSALNHQFASDDVGSVLIVTAAAKLKGEGEGAGAGAGADAGADALIEWLLSEKAQRYFADETFEYPLAPGVDPAAVIPEASFGAVGDLDLEDLEGGLEQTRDLIIEAGFEG